MTSDELRLPPDDAWIERRTSFLQDAEATRIGAIPGRQTTRIIGNLSGAWPKHGRVRRIPSTDGDLMITEASLIVLDDGTVLAENGG
ncbi:hypothetical protein MicroSTF_14125 [Microbacterium sp. STF-2]|uniref:hypothetical protein n=1 Tax=Microbacterium sp. STF-2 TaxID=3031132 RepID=UPI002AFEC1DE|nr:hypothetical protein [Microbacterium sp. STF-2]MEA1264176.1 hypothetical protein [Microbacterium sp. STF-2]